MKKLPVPKRSSNFRLLYYSFLFFILILWGLSFFIVNNIYKNKIIETMNTTLNQGHAVFSEKVSAFEYSSLRFLMQQETLKYMHTDAPVIEGKNFQQLKELKEIFEHDKAIENLPGFSVAFFNKSKSFVGLYGASTRSQYYYDYYLKYSNFSYTDWVRKINEQKHTIEFWPTTDVKTREKTGRYLSLIYKMTDYSYTSGSYSVLCNLIPVENIENYYQGVLDIDTGCVFLTDEHNSILFYSCSEREFVELKDQIESFIASSQNIRTVNIKGKRIIILRRNGDDFFNSFALVDYSVIIDQLSPLNNLFLTAFFLTLGIGIFIAIRSFTLYSRPIKKMSQLLHNYYGYSDEAHYNLNSIHTSLDRIIQINQKMVAQLDRSQGFLQDVFIKHLFQSEFSSNTDLLKMASHANITLPVGEYFVAIFKFDSTNADHYENESESVLQIIHLALNDIIREMKPSPFFTYDEGIHSISALYQLPPGMELKDYVSKHFETLTIMNIDDAEISLTIGISNSFDQLLDVVSAKREAAFVLDSSCNGSHIRYYGDMQQYKSFFYPYEREKALTHMIHKGNSKDAISILKELYTQNYVINPISEIMKQQFLYSICNTILHLIDEQPSEVSGDLYKIHFDLLSLHSPMDMSEQINLLTKIIILLCDMQQNTSDGPEYLDAIIKYIEQNCTRQDFSLQNVADVFHLSTAYVSRQIHQRTKQTFSSLVEQARMELAKNYIINTDEPMNSIAQKCGYINSNTFFKAFKRFYSVSPSAMRRSVTGRDSDVR